MALSEEDERMINAAMETSEGNATEAAKLLEMERGNLYAAIHRTPSLKARWAKSNSRTPPGAPSKAVAIHRPTIPSLPGEPAKIITEDEIAAAIEKEDAAVRRGMDAIGIKGDALELAMNLQKFQNKHFTRAIEMIGGGITKQFMELMVEVDKISKRLDDTSGAPLTPSMEAILRQDRAALLEIMGKTYDRAQRAAMTQAVIKHKLSENANQGPKHSKPGFAPLVKAENVQINNYPQE